VVVPALGGSYLKRFQDFCLKNSSSQGQMLSHTTYQSNGFSKLFHLQSRQLTAHKPFLENQVGVFVGELT
jgi:hypothetical protein